MLLGGMEGRPAAAALLWGELAKTSLAREREMVAEKGRLTRKKAKEEEESERKKARERIRKSFLWELRVPKATKAGALWQWNAVLRRGGARTADECSLRYWAHWSDERVTTWWTRGRPYWLYTVKNGHPIS